MEAAERRFYDAERHRLRRAYREIVKEAEHAKRPQGRQPKPVRRSDGQVYASVAEAARNIDKATTHVSKACKTGRPLCGYTFQYIEGQEGAGMGRMSEAESSKKVYRDVMASLWQGTCKQCKFYAKTGGREVCRRGARTMDTDASATCPRWERVPSHVEAERARLAAEAQAQREEAIQRNREAMERKREREAEAEAYKWEFRGQVLGLQVDYLVSAICKRYDIDQGTGER